MLIVCEVQSVCSFKMVGPAVVERNESSPPIGEQYVATTRLEIQQIYKLIQLMREDEFDEILKLTTDGVPSLVYFFGFALIILYFIINKSICFDIYLT